MHRFFVEEPMEGTPGETVTLPSEESLHAARVLRLKAGEEVQVLDGERLCAGALLQVNERASTVKILRLLESPESQVQVTLFQGLPKADKLEWIVQKATELGVWEIAPVEMERSVAKADQGEKQGKKRERLQRIALEAAKQSGRAHVPVVRETQSLAAACKALEAAAPYDAIWVAWEEEAALRLGEAARRAAGKAPLQRVAVVIGPEGGMTEGEVERLKALGATPVTLGKRILRTETAGLCALAVIWAALLEM